MFYTSLNPPVTAQSAEKMELNLYQMGSAVKRSGVDNVKDKKKWKSVCRCVYVCVFRFLQLRRPASSHHFTHIAESIVLTRWQKSIICSTNAERMQEVSRGTSTMTPTVCSANAG